MLLKRLLDATGDAETEAGPEAEVMRQLLGRVLHLRETPVRSVMGPRSGIVWIGHREGPEAAARLMRESGHSRIPVCGRDLDDVIGTLHLKDVFLALHGVPAATAGALAREPMFVDDDATLSLLLARWRRGGGTMAVVRDRSGIVVGLVTLSDVSEWLLAARRRRRRPPGPED
jgi:putative hemolysin